MWDRVGRVDRVDRIDRVEYTIMVTMFDTAGALVILFSVMIVSGGLGSLLGCILSRCFCCKNYVITSIVDWMFTISGAFIGVHIISDYSQQMACQC